MEFLVEMIRVNAFDPRIWIVLICIPLLLVRIVYVSIKRKNSWGISGIFYKLIPFLLLIFGGLFVFGHIVEIHSEVVSAGLLEVKIINNKNKQPIIQRRFPGEYVWISVWGYYVGDMRALTPEQIEVCRLGRELPPSDQELFVEFTKPIYNRTIDFLTNYYYNY